MSTLTYVEVDFDVAVDVEPGIDLEVDVAVEAMVIDPLLSSSAEAVAPPEPRAV